MFNKDEYDYVASSDEDEEYSPFARKRRPLAQIARFVSLATDKFEDVAQSDAEVRAKIQKALDLGRHSQTGEPEARAVLTMAHRLMSKINADISEFITDLTSEDLLKQAGKSEVDITSPKGTKILLSKWTNDLASAMSKYFTCEHITITYSNKIAYSFYGIATNTAAAASAFASVHDQIMGWTQDHLDIRKIRGIVQSNCYKQGIAAGLWHHAKSLAKAEMEMAERKEQEQFDASVKAEKEQEKARLSRYTDSAAIASVDSEQVDTSPVQKRKAITLVHSDDDDTESKKKLRTSDPVDKEDGTFSSSKQLTLFRQKAKYVAEEWLKANKITLRKARAFKQGQFNQMAYELGKTDAKKINIKDDPSGASAQEDSFRQHCGSELDSESEVESDPESGSETGSN